MERRAEFERFAQIKEGVQKEIADALICSNSSAGNAAIFCARANSFLLSPRSASVGASSIGGSELVPPIIPLPTSCPLAPIALSVSCSISISSELNAKACETAHAVE